MFFHSPPIVRDHPLGIDREMVVADVVLDLRVPPAVRVRALHPQDARPDGDVLVHVVRLVVGQLELGRVVVHVRDADHQLDGGGEAARVLRGGHDQLVDVGLAEVLKVEVLGQFDDARGGADVEGAGALALGLQGVSGEKG